MQRILYTIGHSTHPAETFLELLLQHSVTAVVDVRSSPYSQYNPQFNRETLQRSLKDRAIAYVYLGRELGARREEPDCFEEGKVQFGRVARTEAFQRGLSRLRKDAETFRVALLCSEKDPLTCHRTILVCRHMRSEDMRICHILEDGNVEDNSEAECRLMSLLKIPEADLFMSHEELVESAYDRQGDRIAYVEKEKKPDE